MSADCRYNEMSDGRAFFPFIYRGAGAVMSIPTPAKGKMPRTVSSATKPVALKQRQNDEANRYKGTSPEDMQI